MMDGGISKNYSPDGLGVVAGCPESSPTHGGHRFGGMISAKDPRDVTAAAPSKQPAGEAAGYVM